MPFVGSDSLGLSAELDVLGGGLDTRIGHMEVACRIKHDASDEHVVWADAARVLVRDQR